MKLNENVICKKKLTILTVTIEIKAHLNVLKYKVLYEFFKKLFF